eukprot:2543191-Prymnesium_polylepis.2
MPKVMPHPGYETLFTTAISMPLHKTRYPPAASDCGQPAPPSTARFLGSWPLSSVTTSPTSDVGWISD